MTTTKSRIEQVYPPGLARRATLTEEEEKAVWLAASFWQRSDPDRLAHLMANAATAKALWWAVDWFYSLDKYAGLSAKNPGKDLSTQLHKAGIERPRE